MDFNKNIKQQARPFLKWAGGKSKVITQLLELFPSSFDSYYEPFLGGGALYFAISPQSGRLNDLNHVLIDTYIALRDNPDSLIKRLDKIQTMYYKLETIDAKRSFYLDKRDKFNMIKNNSVEKSALFIFLNKAGFNGMYRENRAGKYNIPFGNHVHPLISDKNNLRKVSDVLKNIDITCLNYEDALLGVSKNDLVYLDPPYYPLSSTSKFTEYQAGGFSVNDQIKLRDVFKELSDKGCFVMMSNSACKEVRELYSEFNIFEVDVARSINSKAVKRGKIKEYVITNYLPRGR
jgi:DNA adenine methylase